MSEEHNWKFAQCFGDKGDSDDITDGKPSIDNFSK
jgi:serine/threonine-protein phosphatase 2A regulatory subunit B